MISWKVGDNAPSVSVQSWGSLCREVADFSGMTMAMVKLIFSKKFILNSNHWKSIQTHLCQSTSSFTCKKPRLRGAMLPYHTHPEERQPSSENGKRWFRCDGVSACVAGWLPGGATICWPRWHEDRPTPINKSRSAIASFFHHVSPGLTTLCHSE